MWNVCALLALVLSCALLAGCKKDEATDATPSTEKPQPAGKTAGTVGDPSTSAANAVPLRTTTPDADGRSLKAPLATTYEVSKAVAEAEAKLRAGKVLQRPGGSNATTQEAQTGLDSAKTGGRPTTKPADELNK